MTSVDRCNHSTVVKIHLFAMKEEGLTIDVTRVIVV